jgi:ribose/xylose/arabinose/galactoside ABC-type transport system permease subunit
MHASMLGEFTILEIWPIGSVVLVACIFVFLGLELLAYWMGSRGQKQENPEFWHDNFSRRSAYGLTVLIVLFVVVCIVMGLAFWLGR